MKLSHWTLIIISSLAIAHSSFVYAMGSPPPEKEEKPKYKLEILKAEIVSAPAQVLKVSPEAKSKYKLEILKMEMITCPSPSPEAKK